MLSRRLSERPAALVLGSTILALAGLAQPRFPAGETFRELSPDQALEAAGKEGKLALLAFLKADSQPTKAYEGFTFQDPQVAQWIAERVVAVRSVGDEEARRRFDVNADPTLVFATPEGAEMDRIDTYLEPAKFLEAAQQILERKSAVPLAQLAVDQSPADARARGELARALLKRKRWRSALEPLGWIYDTTRGDPSLEAERLAFAVERASAMRRTTPEATAWLQERRDRAYASLIEERAEPAPETELALSARELVALNQALNEIRKTVECWDALRVRPEFPRAPLRELFNAATQSILLEEQRFADLLEGAGDPLVLVQEGLSRLRALDEAAGPTRLGGAEHERERWALVDEASRYYLALLKLQRDADAAALADLVLDLEPSAKSYQSLIAVAQSAERYELVQALVQRGLAQLPEGLERQRLQTYSQRLRPKGS